MEAQGHRMQYSKGEVAAMNGKTFLAHTGRGKPGQFKDTLDALRLLASTEYKKDILYLEPLFKKLEAPIASPPLRPVGPVIASSDPSAPTQCGTPAEVDMDIYREELKAYVARKERLQAATVSLYNIAWAQCSQLMRDKLRAATTFASIKAHSDVASLLKEIRAICYQVESSVNIYDAIDELQRQFFAYRQHPEMDNMTHLERFRDYLDVMEHFGIDLFGDKCCISYEQEQDKLRGLQMLSDDDYLARISERRKAVCFLRRSNMALYAPLMRELRDQYLHGSDIYPHSLDQAFSLLQNHSSGKRRIDKAKPKPTGEVVGGMQHAQQSQKSIDNRANESRAHIVPGQDGKINNRITCWSCKNKGHYASNCPENNQQIVSGQVNFLDGATITQLEDGYSDEDSIEFGFSFTQRDMTTPDFHSVLLDTGSNCSVFNSRKLLTSITKSKTTLRAYTNGGHQDSHYKGLYCNTFEVWYNPNSMVNILSFAEVSARFRVTLDTADSNEFIVHLDDGSVMCFREVDSGLYMLTHNSTNTAVNHYSSTFITLVDDLKSLYTKRELEGAERTRKLCHHINMPNYKKFMRLIEANYFRNNPVTVDDVKRALHIYGPDTAYLQGKTTRKKSPPIMTIPTVDIPRTILDKHNNITLSVDYVFIQGITMLHTISGTSYQFRTIEPLFKSKPNKGDILSCIEKVLRLYSSRGIMVTQINCDNEFNCIRDNIAPIVLNSVAADEHVGDIERANRTLKEVTRSHLHRLPFK